MATEIERKFLVLDDSWKEQADSGLFFRQGYMTKDNLASVRVRIEGDKARLNIKSMTLGISRKEYDYAISLADAEEMLSQLCYQPLVEKHRYCLMHEGHKWEIDVFHGDNDGLIVAEIELQHEDEPFARPDWLGREVSDDIRYYNVSLVEHPYCHWRESE